MAKKFATPQAAPMPIHVEEDEDMRPVAITVEGQTLAVDTINERVEYEEAWWDETAPVNMTYKLTLEDGRSITVSRNMMQGGWYRVSGNE